MLKDDTLQPRKQPAQQRSRALVERLLKATAHLLITEGYRGISTNRIAKAAKVSVGSLYQYFPNKNAIVLELFHNNCERQMTAIAEKLAIFDASEETPELEPAVRTLIRAILDTVNIDTELTQVLLREVRHLDEFHNLRTWVDRVCDLVTETLSKHADEIRPEDPRIAAYITVHAINGVLLSAELDRTELLSDPQFADELCQLAIRYLRRDIDP